MSSLQNETSEDDIISAFKSSQNQSWSMFNDKLGGLPAHDGKKKDVFRSENPIKLSDEDIPVFGLVPRLEKLTLVSCNKCSMVVKKDCFHHHYNRRHINPGNDNFSLERFILPIKNINKLRKQKITSIRKLPEKKIIDGEDTDPVQSIDTEFDQLDFERLTEINRVKIKQEIEMQYDDESEENLALESCNTNTSCGVFDWNLPPFTQNLLQFGDHEVNDSTAVFYEDSNKLSSDDGELHSNTFLDVINDENISYVTNSSNLTKSLDSSNNTNPNIVVDFSGIMSDDDVICDEDPNDEFYHLPSKFVNYKEQTKLITDNMDSDMSNNDLSDDIATNYQSSTSPICIKEKTKLTPNKHSENENDECFKNVDQLKILPVDNKEEPHIITPSNNYLNIINNENSINIIEEDRLKVNDDLQNCNSMLVSNKEQTKCSPSNFEYCDKTSSTFSSNCTMNIHETSTTSCITKEYQPFKETLKIKECQLLPTTLVSQEEHQIPHIPLDRKDEQQSLQIPFDSNEEQKLPHIPLDSKEHQVQQPHKPLINNEEYQPPQSPINIKEKLNDSTNSKCEGFLYNEINDSSKTDSSQSSSESLTKEEQKTGVASCEYLNETSNNSSSNSITSHEQLNITSLMEYQPPIELPLIKEKVQIISNTQYSNLNSDKKEKPQEKHTSNDVCKVTPSEVFCSETETKLLSSNMSVTFRNENYNDNVFPQISSSLTVNVQEESKLSQSNNFTVDKNSESTDDSFTSDDQSEITSVDTKESDSSLSTNYSNDSDSTDYTSDDTMNEYYQSAIGYCENAALIPLSQSFEYLSTSSDEEVYESTEKYKNDSYLLPHKVLLNSNDDTSSTSTSTDQYSSDNSITSCDQFPTTSLSNREKSKDILMINILDNNMDNNGSVKNVEDKYYKSSTDSLDSETKSLKCSNTISSNSSNSSSVINYDESSFSSMDTDSKVDSHLDSSFDESSGESVSSSDKCTAPSNSIEKKTKSTQTKFFLCRRKHKKCVNPSIYVDESIAESLSVLNDLNKNVQTNESIYCEDCRRVAADLVEYYYPSNTRIEEVDADIFFKDFYSVGSNAQTAETSVNDSNPVNVDTQIVGHPVNSSAQSGENTNIPSGADQFELNNSEDFDRHINNCLLRLRQFSWNPNNPVKQTSVGNDDQLEDINNINDSDLYADRQDDVLYHTLMSGSKIFINKNHAINNERLKKNINEKLVYTDDCKYVPKNVPNAYIETKVKKNLKRRLGGQVADDKENQEKNNRWISGSFKKLKRLEFVNRKISCSDESDNNVDE